jgi:hypothetical protein
MEERKATKSERRQAAGHVSKAERKQAKLRLKERAAGEPASGGAAGDGIEARLARLEAAVAAQSKLSERLLEKLDAVLDEARRSGSLAEAAAEDRSAGEEASA